MKENNEIRSSAHSKYRCRYYIVLIFFIIIACITVFVKGISFGIAGKFFITTKYYDSAIEAFSSEFVPSSLQNSIVINNQIDIIQLNEHSCLLLAITEDEELLIASMFSKNDKFAFTGEYYVYNSEDKSDFDENFGMIKNETDLYNANGKVIDTFGWCVLFEEKIPSEQYEHKYYTPQKYKDFIFVFLARVVK